MKLHAISTRWSAKSYQSRSHFPHDFWSSYGYLISYQREYIHMLIKWSHMFLPIVLIVEFGMVITI
jgi:hypothetical protein